MNRPIGLALLAGGVVLLIFGIQASHSFSSNVSRVFNGSPTNQSVWMIVLGAILAIVGLVMSFGGGRGTRV
jgi:protein-S-isoprenylcysteine O-methyltransferase Ste14